MGERSGIIQFASKLLDVTTDEVKGGLAKSERKVRERAKCELTRHRSQNSMITLGHSDGDCSDSKGGSKVVGSSKGLRDEVRDEDSIV